MCFFILLSALSYKLSDNELVSYIGTDENVQIPFSIGLTKISDEAFKNNTNVESISIASGINEIGDECFSGCSSLLSVMPSDIVTYGSNIFSSTSNLKVYCNVNSIAYNYCIDNNIQVDTDYDIADGVLNKYNGTSANVVIPNNLCLTQIGNNLSTGGFRRNNTLISVVIPENVVYIARMAFTSCSNLTTVSLPSSLIMIDSFAFNGCVNLNDVNIPLSVESIGSYAFAKCAIEEVDLSNVKTIAHRAFEDCDSLQIAIFSNTTNSIGTSAFGNCSNLIFNCIQNSYAHNYAIENAIAVQLISNDATSTYTINRNIDSSSLIPVSEETSLCERLTFDEYLENFYGNGITEADLEQILLEMDTLCLY